MARTRTGRTSILDQLARRFVGDGRTTLYFVSSRRGVVAVFTSEDAATTYARPRDLYVEGPQGEVLYASWS